MRIFFKFIFINSHIVYFKFLHLLWGIQIIQNKLPYLHPVLIIPCLRAFGAKIGERTIIKSGFTLDNCYESSESTHDFSNLIIGDYCHIARDIMIDLTARVTIGDQVLIGAGSKILTHTSAQGRTLEKYISHTVCEVIIGDSVYCGVNTIIQQGCVIHNNSIIGAGSLVREDVLSDTFVAGIPAKLIRTLE